MYVIMYVCIYAQTAITKKLEVETRLKFTIRYEINWRAIFWYFYIKQEAFFSNPKKYDILFESIKSFAVRHFSHHESAPTNIGNSKIFFQTPFDKRKSSHLSSSYFRLEKWRTAKLLIDSNNMSSIFGFEKMFFVSKNFIRLGF